MKQIAKTLTALLLVVSCVFMVACSTYGKVEKALNEIGYTAIKTNDDADKMEEESDVAVTIHVFSNADNISVSQILKTNIVFVFEFKATEDMKDFYEDSNTMQGFIKDVQEDGSADEFYKSLEEKGYVNGNCLVFGTNPMCKEEVANAIKKA